MQCLVNLYDTFLFSALIVHLLLNLFVPIFTSSLAKACNLAAIRLYGKYISLLLKKNAFYFRTDAAWHWQSNCPLITK